MGSNPAPSANSLIGYLLVRKFKFVVYIYGDMAELVDALDLKSNLFGGPSSSLGISKILNGI